MIAFAMIVNNEHGEGTTEVPLQQRERSAAWSSVVPDEALTDIVMRPT
jgi:hypothetical protein